MAEESPLKPFYSVLVLAFVCSALVAGAAVALKPLQDSNRQLDRKKNILSAAGLYRQDQPIERAFAGIETRIVELATGRFVPEDQLVPETYNQLKAALSPELGRSLDPGKDLARLRRLEKYSLVYLVKKGDKVEQFVLPVRGKGLWSTMFAYVAVDADLNTIRGVAFYEHGETPGLGGEVENSRWQGLWQGKKIYTDAGEVGLRVVKGRAAENGEKAKYEIDGLSGATLTTKGVDQLLEFWFGNDGYKPFFRQLTNKDGANG
jgi:Na+-transporting NADH:ubiquinone oxidoreductase subunit C